MTVYALHGLTGILGSVERVTALSGTRIREREIAGRRITADAHDNTLVLLDFGSGLLALAYGTAAGVLTDGVAWDPSGSYYGTRGRITGLLLDGAPFDYPGRDLVTDPAAEPRRDPGERAGWLLPHVTEAHRAPRAARLRGRHAARGLDPRREAEHRTAEHARHVIDIVDAAYRAAATGTTQRLDDGGGDGAALTAASRRTTASSGPSRSAPAGCRRPAPRAGSVESSRVPSDDSASEASAAAKFRATTRRSPASSRSHASTFSPASSIRCAPVCRAGVAARSAAARR